MSLVIQFELQDFSMELRQGELEDIEEKMDLFIPKASTISKSECEIIKPGYKYKGKQGRKSRKFKL